MKPRTLLIDTPISDLNTEIVHTRSLLHGYSFLQSQAAHFDALQAEWFQLLQAELAIQREQAEAEARAIVVDDGFDFLCVAISASLLAASGGNRTSPVYQRYFGAAPPSKLKRPVLGQQLETMRTWPPSLTGPDSPPVLQEYGRQLAALVVEAGQAVVGLSEAARKRADFEIGPRKAFVDKLNALRLSVYGQLAEIPHKHPERNLSRDFADHFFLRNTGNRKPSLGEVEQTIFRMRERLRKQEELLDRMVAEEDAAARQLEDAELAAAEQALIELEQQRDEAEARVAAVRARLVPQDPQE